MARHKENHPPDYSSGFKQMTGFRHTPLSKGPGSISSGTTNSKSGLSGKKSSLWAVPPGPKKPRPGY